MLPIERDMKIERGNFSSFNINEDRMISLRKEITNLAEVSGLNSEYVSFSEIIKIAADKLKLNSNLALKRKILKEQFIQEGGIYFAVLRTGNLGSEPVVYDKLGFAPDTSMEELTRLGIFYLTSVGQGHNRSFGLFELPVGKFNSYRALIYPFEVTDNTLEDSRMQGRDFCIYCIFFQNRYEELFADRVQLRKKLSSVLKEAKTIKKVDKSFFEHSKSKILNFE